LLTSAEVDFSS